MSERGTIISFTVECITPILVFDNFAAWEAFSDGLANLTVAFLTTIPVYYSSTLRGAVQQSFTFAAIAVLTTSRVHEYGAGWRAMDKTRADGISTTHTLLTSILVSSQAVWRAVEYRLTLFWTQALKTAIGPRNFFA